MPDVRHGKSSADLYDDRFFCYSGPLTIIIMLIRRSVRQPLLVAEQQEVRPCQFPAVDARGLTARGVGGQIGSRSNGCTARCRALQHVDRAVAFDDSFLGESRRLKMTIDVARVQKYALTLLRRPLLNEPIAIVRWHIAATLERTPENFHA